MPAEWLNHSSDLTGRLTQAAESALQALARPAAVRRLRQLLSLLLLLWIALAAARLFWALLPAAQPGLPPDVDLVNPVKAPLPATAAPGVDIDRMVAWHLFGEAGAGAETASAAPEQVQAAPESTRAGIEKGARESRLDLLLRGAVASTGDGMGYAIIEHQREQAVYAVDDRLPGGGQVVLAKVMARQVVLDNNGTYELLTLFEEPEEWGSQPTAPTPPPSAPAATPPQEAAATRVEEEGAALARSYRDRLYSDPQSLVELVTVSAVREGERLLGYRVSPGRQREQFQRLGFRAGDLVTGINGIPLDDPANTVRLYQTMRTAGEAVFDLQRGEERLTLSVNLEESDEK